MDIFLSKDEKMEKLEKKLNSLEKSTERRLDRSDESFRFFKTVIMQMQKDNAKLKKDRDYLFTSYSRLLDRLYDSALSDELRNLIEPMRKGLKENFNFIQQVAKEGLVEKKRKRATSPS
ncbi:MAG: hypothetical protein HYT73_01765 [Candidatus Aenigmarchaeota archaeon]|nr:hypothetical protein [Candidatus Aenigmarchaeota archaeon]